VALPLTGVPPQLSTRFGLLGLINGNSPHVDPCGSADRPQLHPKFATILQLFLAGVVTQLKDRGFDITASVE
jgi:hypothetical protein